jgi:TatA/E family protein of Tat protein translocase
MRRAECSLPFLGYGVLSSLVYPSRVGLLKGAPVFGSIGPQEILIVLVIALVVLGPKKLPEMARSLGKGVKEFKEGINDDDTVDVTADEEEEEEPVSSRVHELPPADLPPAAEAPEPVAAPEPAVAPAGADEPAADAS